MHECQTSEEKKLFTNPILDVCCADLPGRSFAGGFDVDCYQNIPFCVPKRIPCNEKIQVASENFVWNMWKIRLEYVSHAVKSITFPGNKLDTSCFGCAIDCQFLKMVICDSLKPFWTFQSNIYGAILRIRAFLKCYLFFCRDHRRSTITAVTVVIRIFNEQTTLLFQRCVVEKPHLFRLHLCRSFWYIRQKFKTNHKMFGGVTFVWFWIDSRSPRFATNDIISNKLWIIFLEKEHIYIALVHKIFKAVRASDVSK